MMDREYCIYPDCLLMGACEHSCPFEEIRKAGWQPGPWKNSWLKWEKPVPLDEKGE